MSGTSLTRVALLSDSVEREKYVLQLRTHELRCGPQCVTILAKLSGILLDGHLLFLSKLGEATAFEEVVDILGSFDLATMGTSNIMDERVVGAWSEGISWGDHR